MIRVISDVGGPAGVAGLLYGAIAAAVTVGALVGLAVVWLGAAVHGGE